MPNATGVFISYRRSDSQATAGRVCDALKRAFGDDTVFRDIDDIAAGEDFVHTLDKALAGCGVLLAIIGPAWHEQLLRRAERDDGSVDHVRREIETALSRQIDVIPVLVDGAAVPDEQRLPPSLQRLARLQGHAQNDRSWRHDTELLLRQLESRLGVSADDPFRRDSPLSSLVRRAAVALRSPRGVRIAGAAMVVGVVVIGGGWLAQREVLRIARDGADVAFLMPPEGEGSDVKDAVQLFNDMRRVLKPALDLPNVEVAPETLDPGDVDKYRLDKKTALLGFAGVKGPAKLFIHTNYRLDVPSGMRRVVLTAYPRPKHDEDRMQPADGWPQAFSGPSSNKHISIMASFALVEFLADRCRADQCLVRLPAPEIGQARRALLREHQRQMETVGAQCDEVLALLSALSDPARLDEIAADKKRTRDALETSCDTRADGVSVPDKSAQTAGAVYARVLGL